MKRDERRARARNRDKGVRTPEAPCALIWAIESLPEDLWTRSVVCPVERTVMLGATSKRVKALLAGLQRQVPAVVQVVGSASMRSIARGLRGLLAWCQVVKLDLNRGEDREGGSPIGNEGARRLAGVLGQCSSLTDLNLGGNGIGEEGAGRLAGVLGQCSSLTVLNLGGNDIGAEGAGRLAGVLGLCSSLAELDLRYNSIGDDGIAMLRACWPGVLGLDDQFDEED